MARTLLPAGFEPKTHAGHAIVGVCLIRLESIRPKGAPEFTGISSENSAHRFAATWTGGDGARGEGVFVSRRDTSSWLNSLAGGRIFPGVHHHSRFTISDDEDGILLRVMAKDTVEPLVDLEAEETDVFPERSVFSSLEESSGFFEAGCIGYSSRPGSCRLDGLLLKVDDWKVKPLDVRRLSSAFFDNRAIFPQGSIEFDHALLMRDIAHEWHPEPEITVIAR